MLKQIYRLLSHITFGEKRKYFRYLYKNRGKKKQNFIDCNESVCLSIKQLDYKINELNNKINQFSENFDFLRHIVLPACFTHPSIFTKYKNIHKGKNAILLGSGPTFNFYEPIKNGIHIGVNSTFLQDKVKLDYLFIQDRYPTITNKYNELKKYDCKKFFGIHYVQPDGDPYQSITEQDIDENKAERYYFISEPIYNRAIKLMSNDITTRPLLSYASTIFCALDFILWTHPKKLYVVGCDVTNHKHFDNFTDNIKRNIDKDLGFKLIFEGWGIFKEYIGRHYPDVEIISINPIGLKGLFHDVYTKSYLKEHPEINLDEIEILEKDIG